MYCVDINFMEVVWVGVEWVCLRVDVIHCHAVVRKVMTL